MHLADYSLREFEAFRALLAAGTTSAAARRLGVSQSAVSRAVSGLEARMEQTLFERTGSRMQPTIEALALNEMLDPLFDTLARIDNIDLGAAPLQQMRVVAPPTIAHRYLQAHIGNFLGVNPGVNLSLEICASDALVSGIAEARYDIGITDAHVDHSGIRPHPLRASTAVCAVPANHPLATVPCIAPIDLDGEAFIALTRRHSARGKIDRLLARDGAVPKIIVETATAVSAWQFVAQGLGISILNPFPVALTSDPRVVLRPFTPQLPYVTSFFTTAHRPLSSASRAFIKFVRLNSPNDPYSKLVSS